MYSQPRNAKSWLTNLNPIVVLGFTFVLISFFSACKPFVPGWFYRWDVLLPVIVYLGQRRRSLEGLIVSLLSSHLYSLASGAPIGLFTCHYLVIFFASQAVSRAIFADQVSSIFFLIVAMGIFSRLSLPLLAWAFGAGWPVFSGCWPSLIELHRKPSSQILS